ncbi:hypothetical protein EII17_12090 [Clostridiales bacterium COT073_COT-073]|nr:hypothetical protein EII17_12090 [Clostridiales bacterium COT073_COT-073]
MKTNRLFLFFIAFFCGLILLAFTLFFIFLAKNNLSWNDYWQQSDIYGTSLTLPKLKFTKGIKTLHREMNFPVSKKLKITVDIENISFVEENREDILVVYDYRHPHAPEYHIDFKAFFIRDEIQIIATTTAKKQNSLPFSAADLDGIYRGSIEIHLPKDLQLETLALTTSGLNIEQNMLYENADSYILTSSMGNISFVINQPKKLISVETDLGNCSVLTQAPVEIFDLISNLGNAYLDFEQSIDTLYVINSFGNSTVVFNDSLTAGNIQSNVGKVHLFGRKLPDNLNISTLTGDILTYLSQNPSTYLSTVDGTVSSYFELTDQLDPRLYITSHAGNIQVLPPTEDHLMSLKKEMPLPVIKEDQGQRDRIFSDSLSRPNILFYQPASALPLTESSDIAEPAAVISPRAASDDAVELKMPAN